VAFVRDVVGCVRGLAEADLKEAVMGIAGEEVALDIWRLIVEEEEEEGQ
jgi:hypothetical protein